MPRWNLGQLPEPPRFTWKNWLAMLGPGLLMGGASIGGGEWLMGPIVTAKFGGALMWLASLSIIGQVIYNMECSRYTLYSGEPIFTGKFRTLPGPMFWLFIYLMLDFGAVFPYLAANAATPVAAIYLGDIPDPKLHAGLLRGLGIGIFLVAMLPMLFGGKIYSAIKAIMTVKIFVVLGFLLIVSLMYSSASTWKEIFSGFVKVGNFPVKRGEDLNGNGILDPGEDWDGDGRLDEIEEDTNGNGKLDPEEDLDNDGIRDGDNVENIFLALFQGKPLPSVDLSMMAFLSAFIAIAGSGGLSNSVISNYTRDQGWGMGAHVGAIPSIIGGRALQLSHVGTVFQVTKQVVPRWKQWYRHVLRDQIIIWMPACFIGLALPSMLSVEFLPRGFEVDNRWVPAAMTADAVRARVESKPGDQESGNQPLDNLDPQNNPDGTSLGYAFWFMTLFCGFLVLAPSMSSSADGFLRRWVDTFWTASKQLRRLDPSAIRYVYFAVLAVYIILGVTLLSVQKPVTLLLIATTIFNYALGFSCWHVLCVNVLLLPREVRPKWIARIGLFLTGAFFTTVAVISTIETIRQNL